MNKLVRLAVFSALLFTAIPVGAQVLNPTISGDDMLCPEGTGTVNPSFPGISMVSAVLWFGGYGLDSRSDIAKFADGCGQLCGILPDCGGNGWCCDGKVPRVSC